MRLASVRRCAAAVLAASALALAGCSGSSSPTPQTSELNGHNPSSVFDGAGLTPPQPRPSFTLTDTAGKRFDFGSVTGKHPTLLYFGYTNCPDVCPTTMADIAQALTKVPPAVAKQTYVVFVTTDVKHDSAPVIKRWLANFSIGSPGIWVGLRGTQSEIELAQVAAHVTVAEDGGRTHSSQTLLYGPDDYARVAFLQSDSLRHQIAHDLSVVAKGDF